MVKRLIVGLFLGAVVGAILAAVLVQGIGVMSFSGSALGAAGAYLSAALVGVLTGLVAGKPIWSQDGKIEAGLKAFFGALIALGGMFVLRQWVPFTADLSPLKASLGGQQLIGDLPAVSLPIIAAILAGFFELDNGDKDKKDEKGDAKGKGGDDKKVRVGGKEDEAESEDAEEEKEEEAAPPSKKRAR